jgi:hypothetical protein
MYAEGSCVGAEKEDQSRKDAEIAEWKGKLVVSDPIFRSGGPRVRKPAQVDKFRGVLRGPALKKSMVHANVATPPISMFLGEKRNEAMQSMERGRVLEPGVDFKRMISNSKSALAKHGVSQSWYGELRDKNLRQDAETRPA